MMNNPFYLIKLDISQYNMVALNDFMRLFVIQLVSQIFYSINHNTEVFSNVFMETTLYILMGVLSYWFIFNYFISFTNKNDNKPYYQELYTNN